MASANEVRVSYVADIRDLTEQLRSVTGITASEARAQVAAVVAGQKAQAAAAKAAARDTGRGLDSTADSAAAAGASMDDAGKAAVKLRGVLGSISPEAAGMAGAVDDAVDAFEGLEIVAAAIGVSITAASAAVAVLAMAVGVGAAAWIAYNDESARAAEVAALVATATEQLTPLIDATRMAQLDAAVATGDMTAAAAKLEREGIASMKAFGAATADASAQIKALHAGEGTFARWGADMLEAAQGSTILQITSMGLVNTLAGLTESSSEAQTKIDALMGVEGEAAAIVKAGTVARKAGAVATARHATASVSLADALLKEAAAAQSAADKFAAHLAAIDASAAAADAIVAKSGEFRMGEIDKLRAAEDAAIAEHAAAARGGLVSAETYARGEATIRANYQEQITAKQAAEAAARGEIDQASVAKSAASAAANRDAWLSASSSIVGDIGTIAAATARTYDTTTTSGRAAAMQQWKTMHGLSIAQAAVLGLIAVAQAAASAPFPANIPAIAVAVVAGAASVAAVAATPPPTFHAGGAFAPDELQVGAARMLAGEGFGVVNKQGMSAANAGMRAAAPSGSAPNVTVLKLRHQVIDRVTSETIRRGGLTQQAVRAQQTNSVPFGHRGDTWRR